MKSIAIIITMLANMSLFAHALHIETNQIGKIGKAQEIKVYYSEYAEGENEDLKDWYSDVTEFKLFLLSPSGAKSEVSTSSEKNYKKGTFTPQEKGIYTLYIGHSAKDLSDTWMYQFNTSATVAVDIKTASQDIANSNDLQVVLNGTSKKKLKGTVYFKGEPLANAKLEVVSPDKWNKSFNTNELGQFEIPSKGEGNYFIEATHTEDSKGEHYEKPYEHIWRCATVLHKLEK